VSILRKTPQALMRITANWSVKRLRWDVLLVSHSNRLGREVTRRRHRHRRRRHLAARATRHQPAGPAQRRCCAPRAPYSVVAPRVTGRRSSNSRRGHAHSATWPVRASPSKAMSARAAWRCNRPQRGLRANNKNILLDILRITAHSDMRAQQYDCRRTGRTAQSRHQV
jgi:hypothetical protein